VTGGKTGSDNDPDTGNNKALGSDKKWEPSPLAIALIVSVAGFGLPTAGFIRLAMSDTPGREATKRLTGKLTESEREMLKRLHNALKGPGAVDRLVGQIKDIPPEIKEFIADPEVARNLRKLADAVGPANETLDQTLQSLREKKELLNGTRPKNWAKNAIQKTEELRSATKR
jgi:hypothetical protein